MRGTFAITEEFLPFGFVALGLSVVILTGGIDLSVGSISSLAAVIMAILAKSYGVNIWLAIGVAVIIGGCLGWVNGLIITRLARRTFDCDARDEFHLFQRRDRPGWRVPALWIWRRVRLFGNRRCGGLVAACNLLIFVVMAIGFSVLDDADRIRPPDCDDRL